MKVPNTGIETQDSQQGQMPSRLQMLMAAAILSKDKQLDQDEALGLKGANADAARWRK